MRNLVLWVVLGCGSLQPWKVPSVHPGCRLTFFLLTLTAKEAGVSAVTDRVAAPRSIPALKLKAVVCTLTSRKQLGPLALSFVYI